MFRTEAVHVVLLAFSRAALSFLISLFFPAFTIRCIQLTHLSLHAVNFIHFLPSLLHAPLLNDYRSLFTFILVYFVTIQYNYITHHSELTRLQSHLHTNNPVNEFKSETFE